MADWFNESDWLASENPHHLLHVLKRQSVKDSRKFRLASVAACRRILGPLAAPLEAVLAASEAYADRLIPYAALLDRVAVLGSPSLHDPVLQALLGVAHREASVGLSQVLYRLLGCAWGGPELDRFPPETGRANPGHTALAL